MAFEQEFSVEIPEEEADKLTCCADVAKYIVSGAQKKPVEKPWSVLECIHTSRLEFFVSFVF